MLATLEPSLTSLLRPMAIERAPERKNATPDGGAGCGVDHAHRR